MNSDVKKYHNRRDARLGMKMSQHFDSVEEYRLRRAERLKKSRMDADEEGVWRTTAEEAKEFPEALMEGLRK